MKIRIYDVDKEGSEIFRCESDTLEAFGDDDEQRHQAEAELKRAGRVWVGGGSTPLVLMFRVS